MRTLKATSVALALALAPASAAADSWEIDPSHSRVGFGVKHLMVSTVRGEFGKFQGLLVWDEKNPARSSLQATIDTASIDTREAKRDEHLRSPDFFDVQKHPTMTFVSRKVEKAGQGKLKVTGDLTLRGVTKPMVLEVSGPSKAVKDPWGKTVMAASATGKINRKDFGLVWNAVMDGGGFVVGDEVTIHIEVELIKKEAPAEATR